MKNYIAYIDVLGAKNSSEKEDFDDYLRIVSDFQTELLRAISYLEDGEGRIHFFSDCAFIECKNLVSIIECLKVLRSNLFDGNIFIRGAISKGILGAVNGVESEDFIKTYYNDQTILNHFNTVKSNLKKYKNNIRGTLFFSRDLAKVVHYEATLKGSAIFIDSEIINDLPAKSTLISKSGYISNIQTKQFIGIYDIKYDESEITDSFLTKVFRSYYTSNVYDVSYGRYYITIILTAINCSNFNNVKYKSDTSDFENAPSIFHKILNLRKDFKQLYETSKGLEYIYMALINKVYEDISVNNQTTKEFLRQIMFNKKHLGFYKNKISKIPNNILSSKSKNLMIKDFSLLAEDEY